ncbi:hypothetical protein [Cypionkella sp.]
MIGVVAIIVLVLLLTGRM